MDLIILLTDHKRKGWIMKLSQINRRSIYKILIDGTVWSLITVLAFCLRLEGNLSSYSDSIFFIAVFAAPVKFLLVFINGHHKTSWRYSSIFDFFHPTLSIGIFTFLYYTAIILFADGFEIPRTVPVIDAGLSFIAFFVIRAASQILLRQHKTIASYLKRNTPEKRVLIVGAGESGIMIAREMMRHMEAGIIPVGFLDDDMSKQNQRIAGIPVMGTLADIEEAARSCHPDEIIIAMPSEPGEVIRKVLEKAKKANIPCRTIPGLYDIVSGVVSMAQLRNVQVEDLLRRKPVQLDTEKIAVYLTDKRVMVTGAGGSIGSEIIRQAANFYPSKLILVGRGENSIHEMVRECQRAFTHIPCDVYIADVRDKVTLENIVQTEKPEIIFHAAAHKHVYLMESNPAEAVFNNVGGTKNLVELALKYDVKSFVNISSDKAVTPTSVMGASKRIAEFVVENASHHAKPGQNFVSVRFGNVLGSRGSVIPIFREQIRQGGPLTVTHPEMIRYFMLMPEAAQLVLQAGALGMNGAVFVLDMGKPVKIVDMAEDLIRLSGLEPHVDIKIKYTGIRPGEKLYEELLTAEEGTVTTLHEKIFVARKNGTINHFEKDLKALFKTAETGDSHAIRRVMKKMIPKYVYNPEEKTPQAQKA